MVMGSRPHKLQPLFNLVFRRSSIQHPLLAGALGRPPVTSYDIHVSMMSGGLVGQKLRSQACRRCLCHASGICVSPASWVHSSRFACLCASSHGPGHNTLQPAVGSRTAGRLSEDPSNLELLVREDVALQQLVLASMATNALVVEQAVKVIAAAGMYAGAAKRLVKHNVVQAITDLTYSQDKSLQLSGLRVLSSLSAGACEGEVPGEVLMPTQLLDRLLQLIKEQGTPQEVGWGEVQMYALAAGVC
eukprot:GHUV01054150.1.p1 GENE.GHUV01054150.1~~GHUV01054150.1.p1  ORF type:complete len:277 (-),score=77.75 GHUV01054150.1:323-1060(-)